MCTKCPVSYHRDGCIPPGVVEKAEMRICCSKHHTGRTKSGAAKTQHNSDRCKMCGNAKGGALLCCDGCPAAFHPECLEDDDLEKETTEKEFWYCSDCQAGHKCMVGDVIWNKFGSHRWWPARVAHLDEVPDNVQRLQHSESEFPIFFFGSHDWAWVNHSTVMPFEDRAPNPNELKKKPFVKGFEEAKEEHLKVKAIKADMRMKVKEKPPEFKKIARNQYLIPKVKEFEEDLECNCTNENGACGPDSDCLAVGLNIECTDKTCKLGDACQNRKMQRREWKKTVPAKTLNCGYGLHADEDIKGGELVIEYIGEVFDRAMMEERLKKCQAKGITTYYLMALGRDLFIDARTKASNARFVNHACNPNCKTVIWDVNGEKRAGIFAIGDIPKGTELTYDYDFDYLDEAKCKCFCGAPNCSGFIGVKRKTEAVAATTTKVRASKTAYNFFCDDQKKVRAKENREKAAAEKEAAPEVGEVDAETLDARKLAKKEEQKREEKLHREQMRSLWDGMSAEEQAPFLKKEAEWKAERENELRQVKGKKGAKKKAKKKGGYDPGHGFREPTADELRPKFIPRVRRGSATTVEASPEPTDVSTDVSEKPTAVAPAVAAVLSATAATGGDAVERVD